MRFSVLCVALVFLGAVAWRARCQEDDPEVTSALLEVRLHDIHAEMLLAPCCQC